jgi:hypothetical protein
MADSVRHKPLATAMAVKLTTMLPTELRGVTQVKWAQNCHSTKLPSTCDTVFRDTYVSFTGIDGSTIMYSLISCNSVSSTRKYMFVDDVVRFELLLAYGSSVVSPCIATGLIRDCARSGLIIGMFSVLRASTVSCSVCNDKKWIETVCKVCRGSGTVQCGNCITLAQNGICSICRGHHIAEWHVHRVNKYESLTTRFAIHPMHGMHVCQVSGNKSDSRSITKFERMGQLLVTAQF